MTDDYTQIGTVTGTMTFDRVDVMPQGSGDGYLVTGYYMGDQTNFEVPPTGLRVGGLEYITHGEDPNPFSFEPDDHDGTVWVEVTGEYMDISSEQPE